MTLSDAERVFGVNIHPRNTASENQEANQWPLMPIPAPNPAVVLRWICTGPQTIQDAEWVRCNLYSVFAVVRSTSEGFGFEPPEMNEQLARFCQSLWDVWKETEGALLGGYLLSSCQDAFAGGPGDCQELSLRLTDLDTQIRAVVNAAEYLCNVAPNYALPPERPLAPLSQEERDRLEKVKAEFDPGNTYTGTSDAILRVFGKLEQFNQQPDSSVLILGETGVGKTYLARLIHDASGRTGGFGRIQAIESRRGDPTITVERWVGYGSKSGLQGTGSEPRDGYLQKYNGGTIFLDEVANCSSDLLELLLDVLEGEEVNRVAGDYDPFQPEVRMILATNKDLPTLATDNQFPSDVLARIDHQLRIPALKDRKEDIFDFIISRESNEGGPVNRHGDMRFCACLLRYDWPRNVRELVKVLEQATAVATMQNANKLTIDHLQHTNKLPYQLVEEVRALSDDDCEKEVYLFLRDMLERRGWQFGHGLQKEIARILGVSSSTVSRMRDKYDEAAQS